MSKLFTIISETYTSQVKSKSFILMLLLPFIFVIITAGSGFISGNSANNAQEQYAVIANSNIKNGIVKSDGDEIDSSVKTIPEAKAKIKTGDLVGYVTVEQSNDQLQVNYVGDQSLDSDIKDDLMRIVAIEQSQLNIHNGNLTNDQLAKLSIQPTFKSKVQNNNKSNESIIKLISLDALIFILYILLLMYSGITASVIAKEKGSKIIEIIFSSTSPVKYFIGKISGVILMMLTQLAVYVAIIGGSYQFLKRTPFMKKMLSEYEPVINKILGNLININFVFIVLGLIIGILLSAACGALVARKEDAAKAAQPVVFLIMILFFSSLMLQNNSNQIIAKVLSYIPVTSTFFMPIRVINGQVSGLNIAISLVILIVFIWGLIYGIAKIYKGLMLQNDDSGWLKSLIHGIKYH
ncbi:ABC transporter permease [Nicoliella lavandulae]|uniref:ABC transporter permease n=1 Tax=Nicoliella lavandulae TaxID=3082954 RepID=A0ABU8SLX8_9LACO